MVGLPTGIAFKQPAGYSSNELRLIHGNIENVNIENVKFLPLPDIDAEETIN